MNIATRELKSLKDFELNRQIKNLVSEERKLLQVILLHIAEVDRRKLHLRMAYPSLFDYLTREIGYSAGAAQRRIDAARLLQRIPEVSTKIEAGSINLSQISKMQKICRQIKKESGEAVQTAQQQEVFQKLENKGAAQTDLILAQEFQVKVEDQEKRHIQRDESVRVELTFSKEEMTVILRAQQLLSHKTGGRLKETVLEMALKILKGAEPKPKAKEPKKTTATVAVVTDSKMMATMDMETEAKIASVKTKPPQTVTPRLKKEILQRDQRCQFKNPSSGQICGSKLYLEVDHIQPRFANGDNSAENLRVLCKNHNIFRYGAGL